MAKRKYCELDDVQLELLKKGIIDIYGEVDGEMAREVREALIRLTTVGSPSVTLLITSSGGLVNVGLDIYDAIRFYPGEVTGIVAGFAKSMAGVILQACKTRKIMRHAHIMIHHVSRMSINLDELRDEKRLHEVKDGLEKSQERLYAILSDRTKKSVDEINAECAKERDMTAEEALAFGLVDEIV